MESLFEGKLVENYEIFDGDSIYIENSKLYTQEEKTLISSSNLSPATISVRVIGDSGTSQKGAKGESSAPTRTAQSISLHRLGEWKEPKEAREKANKTSGQSLCCFDSYYSPPDE